MAHTGPPPSFHESPSQLSTPFSPGLGITFQVQACLPVSASKACIQPPPLPLPPIITLPLAISGAAPCMRLPSPSALVSQIRFPVLASSAINDESTVPT